MQPFCLGPLRAGWAHRMVRMDFLRPDAMLICLEQTLFLLMFSEAFGRRLGTLNESTFQDIFNRLERYLENPTPLMF